MEHWSDGFNRMIIDYRVLPIDNCEFPTSILNLYYPLLQYSNNPLLHVNGKD
jgi:hypothetical protein